MLGFCCFCMCGMCFQLHGPLEVKGWSQAPSSTALHHILLRQGLSLNWSSLFLLGWPANEPLEPTSQCVAGAGISDTCYSYCGWVLGIQIRSSWSCSKPLPAEFSPSFICLFLDKVLLCSLDWPWTLDSFVPDSPKCQIQTTMFNYPCPPTPGATELKTLEC